MRIHIRILYTILFLVGIIYLSQTQIDLSSRIYSAIHYGSPQTLPLTVSSVLLFALSLFCIGLYGITRPDYMDGQK